ncbi:variable large family protein [Borrelia crocidurae]|nr:variable large family protein [Borrelia crocidurae]
MMVVMVMGCNSGGVSGEGTEGEGKNKFLQSLVNVSNEFLNVFTSFGEMVGSVLGLNVDSKKSDVGKYFKTVQSTVEGIKIGLNKIVVAMKEEKNPNAEATANAVKILIDNIFSKIIEGAKTASEAIGNADEPIGNIATAGASAPGASGINIENLVNGIKSIVEIALKGEGNAEAGTDKKAEDNTPVRAGAGNDGAGKLFDSSNASAINDDAKKAANDASKAVGAVTGADILQAISKGTSGKAVKLAATSGAVANVVAPKDAEVAGAITLRAMVKDGKFANGNANDITVIVKDVSVSAVNKVLNTLTVAIRKTIDKGLKEVKEAMKINTNDSSVAFEKSESSVQNQ